MLLFTWSFGRNRINEYSKLYLDAAFQSLCSHLGKENLFIFEWDPKNGTMCKYSEQDK